jgi:hypothetical protein
MLCNCNSLFTLNSKASIRSLLITVSPTLGLAAAEDWVYAGVVASVQTFLVRVQLRDNLILNIVKVQRLDTGRVLRYLNAEILVARYPDVDKYQGLKSFLLILMICIGLYLLLKVQLGHMLERLLGHEWQ